MADPSHPSHPLNMAPGPNHPSPWPASQPYQSQHPPPTLGTTAVASASSASSSSPPSAHSGLSSYSPISTLERQYDFRADASRFVVFLSVRNGQVPGGVAGLLRGGGAGKDLLPPLVSAVIAPAASSSDPYSAPGDPEGGQESTDAAVSVTDDPFSFLGEDSHHSSSTRPTNNDSSVPAAVPQAPSRSGGMSSLWKRAVKGATTHLERGIHTLALKADQGRSRDWYTLGLYDAATGALLGRTESVQLQQQQDSAEDAAVASQNNTLAFTIPVVVVPAKSSAVVLNLWVRSGAALLQTAKASRNFFLGQVVLPTTSLVGIARTSTTTTAPPCHWLPPMPLQSSVLAGAALELTVLTRDPKFPTLCGAGWSLADPTLVQVPVPPGQQLVLPTLYNLPLEQCYSWGTNDRRVVAVERTIESTVVLPIASAFAGMASLACQRSLEHARSVLASLDAGSGAYKVQVSVVAVHLTDPTFTASGPAASASQTPLPPPPIVSAAWQRPDSVLEVEVLRPTAMAASESGAAAPAFQFDAAPCHGDRVLPSLAAKNGPTLAKLGFLLGSIRFQIVVRLPRARSDLAGGAGGTRHSMEHVPVVVPQHNPFDPVTSMSSLREHVSQDQVHLSASVALEPYAASKPTSQLGEVLTYSIINPSNGRQMGTIAVLVEVTSNSRTVVPITSQSAVDGLVSLVGMAPLCPGVQPPLDFDAVDPLSISDAALQRQLLQLKTLGTFVTRTYLERHITSLREVEARLVADRAAAYRNALAESIQQPAKDSQPPSHQDRSPKPFRPSSSRSVTLLSGIPFNVHTCSLSMMVTTNHPNTPPSEESFYNTSCGAPADHAKDFGNIFSASSAGGGSDSSSLASPVGSVTGGLRRLEMKRQEAAAVVVEVQSQIVNLVAQCIAAQRQSGQAGTHVPMNYPGLAAVKARLVESVQALHHITWICASRRANVFSQALGIAASTFLGSLSDVTRTNSSPWPEVWRRHGYLISFEGLLSAAGKELGMIEDAFVGIAMLRMASIVLVRDDGQSSSSRTVVPSAPYVRWVELATSGQYSSRQFTLRIGVVPSYYDQRVPAALRSNIAVRLQSLLFEVGVDIRQWGANTGTSVLSQLEEQRSTIFAAEKSVQESGPSAAATADDTVDGAASATSGMIDDEDDDVGVSDEDVLVQLNYEGFRLLNAYANSVSPNADAASARIHPMLETLHHHIVGSAGKMNHNILVEAANLCRQLGGGAAVFCKSGKDRTAMHVTYKQAAFAREYRERHLPTYDPTATKSDPESAGARPPTDPTLEVATLLRTYGTRLPICEKNVGQAKYAFNSLQVKFMPESLKPPMNTLAGFLKGGKLFEGSGIES